MAQNVMERISSTVPRTSTKGHNEKSGIALVSLCCLYSVLSFPVAAVCHVYIVL